MSHQEDDRPPTRESDEGITQHDERPIWRCPQLGGPVTFGYCRRMNDALPCARILHCWADAFDVHGFLQEHYDRGQMAQIESGATTGRMDILRQTLERVLGQQDGPSESDGKT